MIIKTPHIQADILDIAKTVIMPGDPKRSKYIAEKFLSNTKLINDIRGVQGYTGFYKDKKITVMSHGMGMPSMMIYSYELFNNFDVENIIRIGSCGAIDNNTKLRDLIIVNTSVTNSNIARNYEVKNKKILKCSKKLLERAKKTAKKLNINAKSEKILCSDVFYDFSNEQKLWGKKGAVAVEMESFALYLNAQVYNKNALTLLTVSDLIYDKTNYLSPEERQSSLNEMIVLALEMA